MSENTQKRFVWAHKCLRINAKDTILEIGCGAGLLAELIVRSLDSGKLVAIDKSKSMITKARQRLLPFIDIGKVELITQEVAQASSLMMKFDKVISFNVNIFWKGTSAEFQAVRNLMKADSSLYVFYDSPAGSPEGLVKKITRKLKEEEFEISELINAQRNVGSVFCVKAKLA